MAYGPDSKSDFIPTASPNKVRSYLPTSAPLMFYLHACICIKWEFRWTDLTKPDYTCVLFDELNSQRALSTDVIATTRAGEGSV